MYVCSSKQWQTSRFSTKILKQGMHFIDIVSTDSASFIQGFIYLSLLRPVSSRSNFPGGQKVGSRKSLYKQYLSPNLLCHNIANIFGKKWLILTNNISVTNSIFLLHYKTSTNTVFSCFSPKYGLLKALHFSD